MEIDAADLAVLDGYCSATGKSRTEVIRQLINEWSSEQVHVATLICRVAGINPHQSESDRSHARPSL
jgi:uracil phosphoribosyltransferase